jgi:peptidoglycan glycosyltransferase
MTLTQRIWHIIHVMLVVLALLSSRIVYWQLVRGPELAPVVLDPVAAAAQYRALGGDETIDPTLPVTLEALPQPVIQRTQARLAEIRRGPIYDRNGRRLAYDYEAENGRRVRFYTEPSLAHVIGYVSGLRTGVTGIEYRFNETLLGLDRFEAQLTQMVYQPLIGNDLYLTIDSRTQRAASRALGDRTGAVVVLDARTGAVLAMASQPAYDPNRVLDEEYTRGLYANCNPASGCQNPFFNRAAQGAYVPGSTWKTITLIAALDTGQATPETVFDVGPPVRDEQGTYYVYRIGGSEVVDRNHPDRVLDLTRAYMVSANAVFGRLGGEMTPATFVDYAARLGFSRGEAPPLEIETSAAQLANDPQDIYENDFLRAITAIGQGELLTSPLNMALVVAAVLNEGDTPRPHLLQAVRHPSGDLLQAEPTGNWINNTMRPETARQVRQIMIAMVRDSGIFTNMLPGLTTGGKTGTAETVEGRPPHSWFIGFVENDERAVVIAVVAEHGGQGGGVAAPIFAQVADAAMHHLGEPVEEIVPAPVTVE